MELKDFVKQTIVQISEALIECNDQLKDKGVVVNPKGLQVNSENSQAYGRESEKHQFQSRVAQKLDFDVAVTVQDDQSVNAGAKISVLSLKMGGEAAVNYGNKAETRIKFRVPIMYPEGNSE